jgi:phosphomevalonate kinase
MLMQPPDVKLAPVLGAGNAGWDHEVRLFRLPPRTRIMLADVDAGSDTPSLVGKVLKWRAAEKADGAFVRASPRGR